ncbi:hypothetical protein [Clostridium paridis]|uniref:Lipoprotein n=1 Tax=Clostridium paridis TaxID=2803863 RepID=A0A937K597_9CLOT|nr:hypothetical protein [Clostridium paridis]MBL4932338.1 hypothetical protein [Clostridium paridis]
MRKLLVSLVILISLFTLVGCAKNKVSTVINVYPASMLIYNNTNYYITAEIIPSENLDKKIGSVRKQVTPSPNNDGEANECPVGTEIFSARGVDIKEAIVVSFNNEYRKAITKK